MRRFERSDNPNQPPQSNNTGWQSRSLSPSARADYYDRFLRTVIPESTTQTPSPSQRVSGDPLETEFQLPFGVPARSHGYQDVRGGQAVFTSSMNETTVGSYATKKGKETLGPQGRSDATKKGQNTRGSQGRSDAAKKGKETLGPQGRSDAAKKGQNTRGPQGRSDVAKKGQNTRGPQGRSDAAKKGKETLGPQGRSDAAKKGKETLGPQGRSDAIKRGNETKRADKLFDEIVDMGDDA